MAKAFADIRFVSSCKAILKEHHQKGDVFVFNSITISVLNTILIAVDHPILLFPTFLTQVIELSNRVIKV